MDDKIYSAKSVGERLRWFRKDYLKLKQDAFSKSIGLPTRSSLSQYETGFQRLPIEAALAIMEVYGLSLDFLYFNRRNSVSADMLRALELFDDRAARSD